MWTVKWSIHLKCANRLATQHGRVDTGEISANPKPPLLLIQLLTMATTLRNLTINRDAYDFHSPIPEDDVEETVSCGTLFLAAATAPVWMPLGVIPYGLFRLYKWARHKIPVNVKREDDEYFSELMRMYESPDRVTQDDVDLNNRLEQEREDEPAQLDDVDDEDAPAPVQPEPLLAIVENENRDVEGRRLARRRRRIPHRGLFDIVDFGKSHFPPDGDSTVMKANAMVVRDYLRKEMSKRNWRTADVARWLPIAVKMVLTPTDADVEAALFAHSSYAVGNGIRMRRLQNASRC